MVHGYFTSLKSYRTSIFKQIIQTNEKQTILKLWLEGNKLSLNVTKNQSMLIGSRPKLQNISNSDVISPKFVIDDEVVPMINEAKYLGIQIDKTLGWKEHINIIAAKISRGIGMLRYAKRYVPLSTVKTMYRSSRTLSTILLHGMGMLH